ncbi:DMT family transporter [Methylovirgula sp. 4M-Z18]|uniref:DMT family transporter n=1 Tax=Methylovirgula sp. 4M-Z18 TaxID=2293567 RepID=UPI000E2F3EB8|nr:DMT family transporter [Methylovirgula sp. 4M-Z18]RFB79895.1 DMT family transporter [Methylovirgula sp. 4M-Z18]
MSASSLSTSSAVDDSGGADARERRQRRFGILLVCGTMVGFSCMDTSAKWLNHVIPTVEVIWARYAVALVLSLIVANPVRSPALLVSRRPGLQLLRSLLMLLSTALNFFALRYLQLTETTAINFSLPLLVALLAGPILGEKVGRHQITAIAIGFAGVLVVVRPGIGAMHPAAILSILGVFAYAGYVMMTRLCARYDPAHTTMIYSTFAGVVLTSPLLYWFWQTPPDATTIALMLFMGFGAIVAHLLLIWAHERAPASVLAPFFYTQIVWMGLLGYLVFGDLPDGMSLLGAAIVIASGLYLWSRERASAS